MSITESRQFDKDAALELYNAASGIYMAFPTRRLLQTPAAYEHVCREITLQSFQPSFVTELALSMRGVGNLYARVRHDPDFLLRPSGDESVSACPAVGAAAILATCAERTVRVGFDNGVVRPVHAGVHPLDAQAQYEKDVQYELLLNELINAEPKL